MLQDKCFILPVSDLKETLGRQRLCIEWKVDKCYLTAIDYCEIILKDLASAH